MSLVLLLCGPVIAQSSQAKAQRIVTLSPHLAEWVYLLGAEQYLVGVSAFSDYPAAAGERPIVADANGINYTRLLSLQPTLVLAWQGGNKPQDISRIRASGIDVFTSAPKTLDDIASELKALGQVLQRDALAESISQRFLQDLKLLRQRYQAKPAVSAFYYLWHKPLMTIGQNAWPNQFLAICNIHNIFIDSPVDYPEVRFAEVMRRKPDILITTVAGASESHAAFWQTHSAIISAPIISVDANKVHRFTPRIIEELSRLCEWAHANDLSL